MTFPTGQIVAITGAAGATGAAAIAAFLNRSSAELESGQLVRDNIPASEDIFAPVLVGGIGTRQRGWTWRVARSGRRAGERIIHPGLDIAAPQGTPINAARSGIVEQSGQNRGYGEIILLRHRDGSTTWYAHLNDRLVNRGQIVRGGDQIANMGRTSSPGLKPTNVAQQGRPSDPRCQTFAGMNPHIHFSVHGASPIVGVEIGPLAERGRKLPALAPARTSVRAYGGADLINMSTDNHAGNPLNEYQYGIDPEAWLGQHGIRQSLAG